MNSAGMNSKNIVNDVGIFSDSVAMNSISNNIIPVIQVISAGSITPPNFQIINIIYEY